LAGGRGNRLSPFTNVVNKSVLPIYDKPTIYFPILSMVNVGIKEIIINTNSPNQIQSVLSDNKIEADISYHVENDAKGLAAALYDMKERIRNESILVMLGDIYLPFSIEFNKTIRNCCIYQSTNYERSRISEYGVAQMDQGVKVLDFREKPIKPIGNYVHMGVTNFPKDLITKLDRMDNLPGKDLTDVANLYHKQNRLTAKVYDMEWFNVGTPEDLFVASQYRRNIVMGAPDN